MSKAGIKEEFVEVALWSKTISHLRRRGYDLPKRRDKHGKMKIEAGSLHRVNVADLAPNSGALVTRVCDRCGREDVLKYRDAVTRGLGMCRACVNYLENVSRCTEEARRGKSLGQIHPLLAAQWHPLSNGALTPFDILPGSNIPIWWLCDVCGHSWKTDAKHRSKGSGCPRCSESKGEKKIRAWLVSRGVPFESQVSADGLFGVGGNPLSFDFLIKGVDGAPLLFIEYDGEFHFSPIDGGRGTEDAQRRYDNQKEHDLRKTNFCVAAGVRLLRICYTQFDQIPQILLGALVALDQKEAA